MKKEMENIKKNNKGFSLVELIVVIAIMAVLIAVLSPQLLRYVEKTRLQRDNSAIAEIANACKIAAAEEKAYNYLSTQTGQTITYSATAKAGTTKACFTIATSDFGDELIATVGDSIELGSSTYNNISTAADLPKIVVTIDNGNVKVTGHICENVGGTKATDTVEY